MTAARAALTEDHRIFDELDEALFTTIHDMATATNLNQTTLTVAGIEALARELARTDEIGAAPLETVAYLRALADLLQAETADADQSDIDAAELMRSQAAARLCIAYGASDHPNPKGRKR